MKSFEAELGAADAKAVERKFVEQAGGAAKPDEEVIKALDTPELSLESAQDERDRIGAIRKETTGQLNELRLSEKQLRDQGIEPGVNPNMPEQDRTPAKEYFAIGERDPRIESDEMAEWRLKDPAKAERYAGLKRDQVSRKADIGRLQDQIDAEKDEVIKAAQKKVLGQFNRELEALEREMNELKQSF